MGEWKEMPFSEAVLLNPPTSLSRGDKHPFVDMAAINTEIRCAYPTGRRLFKGGGSRFQSGDTLMARITPCLENGKIALYCAPEGDAAHGSTEFIVIRGRPGTSDGLFAYYLTRWNGVSGYAISQMTGTSGRQRVPTAAFDSLVVDMPPLPEQRAIAHILGTLDDKIELNRRMNETLEAMARALFKSWFVDFDPVRAKMEGRWRPGESLPGLPAHLYDLFPDRLVDSELGEIPEGWTEITLGAYASLNPEIWSKTSQPPMIRYVDLSNTKWGRIEATVTYPMSKAPSRAKRVLRPGDTIVGTVRPGNGSYALVYEDGLTGSTGFAVVRPLQEDYAAFVYLAATARGSIDHLAQLADGGAYPAVKPDAVTSLPTVGPPAQVLSWFSQAASPLLRQFSAREHESRTLSALRDALLPRLISGEIRVSEGKEPDPSARDAHEGSE
ncbi:MAG: Type I restriction modification DNA specificity domain protein [Actinobacteria bacterium ADurb.Bin444]|nr:MAG: Type I restriction modification DNA specificity domain protein [Actinobacteria bacterium ADurb.Bin444]